MIYREHYIEKVREFYESDLIKIITGIRRSGKSIILEQIMREIGNRTENIIYLNFEDKRVSANIKENVIFSLMKFKFSTVGRMLVKPFAFTIIRCL